MQMKRLRSKPAMQYMYNTGALRQLGIGDYMFCFFVCSLSFILLGVCIYFTLLDCAIY